MTPQQIVALSARFFSIWIMTYSIRFIVSMFGAATQLQGTGRLVFPLMGLGMAAVALLVWLYPMAIANKILPRTVHTNIISMPGRHVAALAAATMGVWVIIESMSYVAGIIRSMQDPSFLFTPGQAMYIVVALAPLGIGTYFLKNPFSVADRVLPVRRADSLPPAQADSRS